MNNETNNNSFAYTYSAKQQEEIKSIREKYVPREESKMEQLLRLDADVTKKGTLFSLIIGILSALILGIGMCFCLVWNQFIPGIIICVIGIAGIAMAYPVYMHITEKERERIAPEIIRLTDELMQ